MSSIRFPNESEDYRRARTALLAEEVELRRHLERVAAQRRALPEGGAVTKDYAFVGERGRYVSPISSAHTTPSSSTSTCTGLNESAPARCAPR